MLCQTYLHENRVSEKTLGVQIALVRQARETDSKKICRRPVLLAEFCCTKSPFLGNFWPLLSYFGYFWAIFGQIPCMLNGPPVAINYGGLFAVYVKFFIVDFGHFQLRSNSIHDNVRLSICQSVCVAVFRFQSYPNPNPNSHPNLDISLNLDPIVISNPNNP